MKKSLKIFATSKWFDLFGVALVVGIAIASGYLNSRLDKFVDWGPWTALVPFGLISVTNVGISMLSTRFTGKLSKWGNYFGIVNTICLVLLIISLEIRRPLSPIPSPSSFIALLLRNGKLRKKADPTK